MNAAGPAAVSPQTVRPSRWVLPPANSAAASLAQSAGLPLIVAELLAERGVRSAQQADLFLHPRIEHLLDPYAMQGMAAAVSRVQGGHRSPRAHPHLWRL